MSRALDFANDISTLESKFSGDTLSNVVIDAGQILGTDIDTLENAGPYIPVNITNPTDTQILAFDNGVLINQDQIEATSSNVDHDLLTNFVANEHIDWTNATENFSTSGTLGVGSNSLVVDSSGNTTISSLTATTSATLQHSSSTKLATTSTGIDVTGTVVADGLTVDTDAYRRLLLTYPDAFTSKLQVGFSNFYVEGSSTTDKLTIANNSSGQTHFENQNKTSLVIDNSGDISFYEDTGTTAKFFWDASAEFLGIGTSSPPVGLSIQGTTSDAVSVQLKQNTGSGRDYRITSRDDGSLRFNDDTAGLERMRITSSGGLQTSGTTAQFISSDNNINIQSNRTSGTTFAAITVRGNSGSDLNLIIWNNGNVVNAGNSYGALSDEKLKENIIDATPKLEDLCKVRVVNYNLKTDPEHKHLGVIAQELENVFPNMIDNSTDYDADGNDLGTTTKSVKYSVFTLMLIKATQEQQALIESQQTQIDSLQNTVTDLLARIEALESN